MPDDLATNLFPFYQAEFRRESAGTTGPSLQESRALADTNGIAEGAKGMDGELTVMYAALLKVNARAFAGRHFGTAAHALASALHCACDLSDEVRLAEVRRLSREQGDWINANS